MPDPEEEKARLAKKNIQTSQNSKLGRYQITSSSGAKHIVVTKPNQSGTGFVVTKDGAFVGYASKGGSPQEQKLQRQIDKGVSQKGSHDYIDPKTGTTSTSATTSALISAAPEINNRPDLVKNQQAVTKTNNNKDVLTNYQKQVEDISEIKKSK